MFPPCRSIRLCRSVWRRKGKLVAAARRESRRRLHVPGGAGEKGGGGFGTMQASFAQRGLDV